jgi:tripartite-type tricarboxylate transporter receptor subunit TctC
MMRFRRFWLLLALACMSSAHAQETYPNKPVRVVIPFPPGGTLDKVGRMLAQRLSEQWGHSVLIDNRPGGNGVIGGDLVAKSAADAYTLLFNASTFVTAPLTMRSVPYKTQTDFAPIALVALAPLSIAVSNKLGVHDLKSFIQAAKAQPEAFHFATGSIGSAGHLCTAKLEQAAGINLRVVPYKGTAPAFQDLIGGQIEGFIDPVLGSVQFHRNQQLKVLAVTSTQRLPNLPDVATASETLSGFECASWYGLWAPAKTSPERVQWLNAEVNKALANIKERLLVDGLVPAGGSVESFARFQERDIAVSGKIISDKKISLD